MSLEMAYIVGNVEFSIPLRDDELFKRLDNKYPQDIKAVFGVKEDPAGLGTGRKAVSRLELLAAVERLVAAFKQDADLTPLRYVFDYDIIPGVSVTGRYEAYGIELPDKKGLYCLFGGIGQCVLREHVNAHGSGLFPILKGHIDVRDQTAIETKSHGTIIVRTTKKRSPISGDIKRLQKFLKSQTGETVVKLLR